MGTSASSSGAFSAAISISPRPTYCCHVKLIVDDFKNLLGGGDIFSHG